MSAVIPYCGQNQQQQINVPASIAYREGDMEEGPWGMLAYGSLWPQPPEPGVFYGPMVVGPNEPPVPLGNPQQAPAQAYAFLPPPISKTDLWAAQQVWPL